MPSSPANTPSSSPADAALSLFPLARAHPRFVVKFAAWSGLLAVVQSVAVQFSGLGAAMNVIAALDSRAGTSPQGYTDKVMAELAKVDLTVLLPVNLVLVVAGVVLSAMALRKTVRNEEAPGTGLMFGRDELALLMANLVILGVMLVGFVLLGALFQGLIMVSAAFAILLPVVLILALVLALGRLGLWGVVTIANGRSSIRETWAISRKGFWGLIGAYLLWGVIGLVGFSIIGAIAQMLAAGLGVRTAAGVAASFGEALQPGWLVYNFISGFSAGLVSLGFVCVGAFTWHGMGPGRSIDRTA